YGSAGLLTFPGFDRVGDLPLPAQEQGEAIAVGEEDRVLVSTEGRYSPIHEVAWPAVLRAALAPEPEPQPAAGADTEPDTRPDSASGAEDVVPPAEATPAPEPDDATRILDGPAVPVALTALGLLVVGLVLRRPTRGRQTSGDL